MHSSDAKQRHHRSTVAGCCMLGAMIQSVLTMGGCADSSRQLAAVAINHLSIISTPHYAIYTTVHNPRDRAMLSAVLEAEYSRFIQLVPGAAPSVPMRGYVFANRLQWALFTQRTQGVLAAIYLRLLAGGYTREGEFALYRLDRWEMLSVSAHEAWHQFSYLALKDHLPAWLDEGLATQNEAIGWHDGKPVFEPWLNYPRWASLKEAESRHDLWSLKRLITTQAGHVVMLPPARIAAYYAQIWSLALFLEHSHYRAGLVQLLQAARRGSLGKLLLGTGVTKQDMDLGTLHWNRTAGPIYLRAYISPSLRKLDREYQMFMLKLVQSWPPPQSHRHYPIHWWKGAGLTELTSAPADSSSRKREH